MLDQTIFSLSLFSEMPLLANRDLSMRWKTIPHYCNRTLEKPSHLIFSLFMAYVVDGMKWSVVGLHSYTYIEWQKKIDHI